MPSASVTIAYLHNVIKFSGDLTIINVLFLETFVSGQFGLVAT
jgi:hypothetical protein